MKNFDTGELKKLYTPPHDSHKGQNGKLLIIGGSHLFHAASLWALEIASKICDMVFYSSVPENNAIVHEAKSFFRNGIVVPRENIEDYIEESDSVLIGPGMNRTDKKITGEKFKTSNIREINEIKDDGEQAYYLTKYLLQKFPRKKWVIDAGSLQMLDPKWLLQLKQTPILTPHPKEFERTFDLKFNPENQQQMAAVYKSIILVKGPTDIVCSPQECVVVKGGNAGMTKGGTGDVLAGLTAALYCKNDAMLSALCASFFNKKAGESLFEKSGYYFNASDLVNEIPKVMKEYILKKDVEISSA